MDPTKSPISGRAARYFRAVDYKTGLAAPVCESISETTAIFAERYGTNPPDIVCATSKVASDWWDADGQADTLIDRTGRPVGEVWTIAGTL